MLTYFAVGPNEQQTWSVAYLAPGTKVASIVLEHMGEQTAISEAGKLNAAAARQEKAVQLERELCSMRRIQRDLQGVV